MKHCKAIEQQLSIQLTPDCGPVSCYQKNRPFVLYIKPHKGDNDIWYFDTEVYQIEGLGRFYLGIANHIKILECSELEQYVSTFVKENLK